MSLTKSLHTVTAVVRVAKYVEDMHPVSFGTAEYIRRALRIFGYDPKGMENDPTFIACIKAFNKDAG